MKKKLLLTSAFALISSLAIQSQTIVSTTPENKNVILEEFTGINCVYCPSGHAIAESIRSSNPNDVFLINVHTGGYAIPSAEQPDFTTSFGSALASQSNLTGYPSGTVNRHVFSGLEMTSGGTAMSRGNWQSAANQILTQSSYVNVATQANVDVATREITVLVEAYFTANGNSTNKLNLALLQNNTEGPQTGGNMGDNYVHQHRLVHLITGQWGEDITTTSQGSFISKTYTYTIPKDYNDIGVELSELEVVAFVTEGNQEIINGHGTDVTYSSSYNNEISLFSVSEIEDSCDGHITPEITISNLGNTPLTSLIIDYNINNGTTYSYTWTGNLVLAQNETITLPEQVASIQQSNIVNISIPTDEDTSNNTNSISFNTSLEGTRNITVEVRTDYFPGEMTWEIYDSAETLVASGGPYVGNTNGSGGGQDAFTTKSHSVTLPQADCYTVKLLDSYGDGWAFWDSTVPTAGFDIYSGSNLLYTIDGSNFGSELEIAGAFRANSTLAVDQNDLKAITIYPNPSTGKLFVSNLDNFDISIADVRGVSVLTAKNLKNNTPINIESLETGVYFVNLKSENTQKTIKLIKE
ncbi:T9SS type A sorting domain-containing protein [Mesonia phycicola]|nr:Omp28-related outer membrane protein [Mesonia phycicola]